MQTLLNICTNTKKMPSRFWFAKVAKLGKQSSCTMVWKWRGSWKIFPSLWICLIRTHFHHQWVEHKSSALHRTKTSLFRLYVQLEIWKLKSSPETGSILFFEQSNIYSGVQKCLYYQTLFLLKCAAICNFVKVHGFHKGIFPPLYVLSHHSLYVWKKS